MAIQSVSVPDLGGAESVDVIEVSVAPGDEVALEDALIVLESDKASMEVPSPAAGKIVSITVKEGDSVSEGDPILEIELEGATEPPSPDPAVTAANETASDKDHSTSELSVDVPDLGGAESVDVIEVSVAVGDEVAEGDALIVLESDKASMEVPSPAGGRVVNIAIEEGAKVSEGTLVLTLEVSGSGPTVNTSAVSSNQTTAASSAPASSPVASPAPSAETTIDVPDLGGAENVDVIEVSVAEGDDVTEGDTLVVLESDKASLDIPSPLSGKIISLSVKEGQKVSQGDVIAVLSGIGSAVTETPKPATEKVSRPQSSNERHPDEIASPGSAVYAGPAVRKLARQLGVDLTKVTASGPKGRLTKDDVKGHVKNIMTGQSVASTSSVATAGIPAIPDIDFSKFGEVELIKMSKIQKVTAANMVRNWLNVPHVTQFDDADITELEEFRKGLKAEAEKAGVKLTPVPFLLKAAAAALQQVPSFNVSLHSDGEQIVKKKYIHIGMAVATPNGLVVPVIRDVDQKGIYQLAEETLAMAKKARDGKLMPNEMQGGCFTVSSLGAIGGTGFTPIVNAPEVGILGVSKASIKPVWNGSDFVPRQMLPLALSYDHRAINGADAGQFMTYLVNVLSDVRKLLL